VVGARYDNGCRPGLLPLVHQGRLEAWVSRADHNNRASPASAHALPQTRSLEARRQPDEIGLRKARFIRNGPPHGNRAERLADDRAAPIGAEIEGGAQHGPPIGTDPLQLVLVGRSAEIAVQIVGVVDSQHVRTAFRQKQPAEMHHRHRVAVREAREQNGEPLSVAAGEVSRDRGATLARDGERFR
jgi:hypothetical protein